MDNARGMENRDFVLEGGVRVPISRKLYTAVQKQYADYLLFKLSTNRP